MENRTGLFSNGVIWFGVAVSVSEIEAGIQLASSSPIDSIWLPLVLGHIIGGAIFYRLSRCTSTSECNGDNQIHFWKFWIQILFLIECDAAYSMGSCAECSRCSGNDGFEFTYILHSNMHNPLSNHCNMGLCWTLSFIKSNHCNDGGAYSIACNPIL